VKTRHGAFLRALDYVFILRPTVMVVMWVFFVSGVCLASRAGGVALRPFYLSAGTALAFASMTLILGGGCLLNQIVDVETDRANDKLFFLPRGIISMGAARLELALVWIGAAVLSAPLSAGFRLVALAALLMNITYSAPPVRAKSRFPLDLVWNGLGFGFVSVAAGWASVAPLTAAVVPFGLVYALAVAGVTASTTIPDEVGDRGAGLATTASAIGARATSVLTIVLVAAAAAGGAIVRDRVAFFGSVVSLPLFVRAHITGLRRHRVAADQLVVAAFALIISVRAPYMLVLLAAVYLGSRAYYRARFGFSYPGVGTP
jgi:4-hydroxybenzoate polyprenyltransferase